MMFHQGRLFFVVVLLVSLAWAFETRSSPTSSSMPQRQSTTRSSSSDNSEERITEYSIQMNRKRAIPPKVLIGYGSNSDKIRDAVQQGGVNIVIWSFVNFRRSDDGSVAPATGLSLEDIKETIHGLDSEGYDQVLHLMAIGGWNGQHLDPLVTAEEWFQAFLDVGIFHGVDWDLEGNDNLSSIYNTFTMSTLDQMGDISRLLHEAGYVVTMAPPQSYLDIDSPKFSRLVNLTDDSRGWQRASDFSYYGRNVYAYLLAKYGDYIDLISIQFYESYARSVQAVVVDGMSASSYLVDYVTRLANLPSESFRVDFSTDPSAGLPPTDVKFPLSKLVLGFANGWAAPHDTKKQNEKVFFASATDIEAAWDRLKSSNQEFLPRGLMYWTINEEGLNDVHFARDLGNIIHRT